MNAYRPGMEWEVATYCLFVLALVSLVFCHLGGVRAARMKYTEGFNEGCRIGEGLGRCQMIDKAQAAAEKKGFELSLFDLFPEVLEEDDDEHLVMGAGI